MRAGVLPVYLQGLSFPPAPPLSYLDAPPLEIYLLWFYNRALPFVVKGIQCAADEGSSGHEIYGDGEGREAKA